MGYPNKKDIPPVEELHPEGSSTISETAFYFSCVPQTIRRQIDAGRIQAFRLGRQMRIPNREIIRIKYGQ